MTDFTLTTHISDKGESHVRRYARASSPPPIEDGGRRLGRAIQEVFASWSLVHCIDGSGAPSTGGGRLALGSLAPVVTAFLAISLIAAAALLAGPVPSAAAASSCPNEAIRAEQTEGVEVLSDCRAWEMVSPQDKNTNDIDTGNTATGGLAPWIGETGNGIGYCSGAIFGEPPNVFSQSCGYVAGERTATGWHNAGVEPVYCPLNLGDSSPITATVSPNLFSRDLESATFNRPEGGSCSDGPLDPAAPAPSFNAYRTDLDPASSPDYQLLNPAPAFTQTYNGASSANTTATIMGGNADLSRIFYTSTGKQTGDAPAGNFTKVYEWTPDGVSLVSTDPEGNPLTTDSALPRNAYAYHGISESGERVLFQNPIPKTALSVGNGEDPFTCATNNCELYLHEAGHTVDVSASECTDSCGTPSGAFFLRGTPDLSKVFFSSKAKLVDEDDATSGYDLYMWTRSDDPETEANLTLLSNDNEPADGTGANVQDVLGASDDGNTVFFVSTGQIVAGAPTAPGYKIYRWHWNGGSPVVDYLFALSFNVRFPICAPDPGIDLSAAMNWFRTKPGGDPTGTVDALSCKQSYGGANLQTASNRMVSSDGRYLMIQTPEPLDPGVDQDGDTDLYRWSEEDGLQCVTCQPAGSPSNGASFIYPPMPLSYPAKQSINTMSADGTRIFFDTLDSLVPADRNGTVQDVYEWEAPGSGTCTEASSTYSTQDGGCLSLISSGTDPSRESYLLGVSNSGDDVFFVTGSELVGWDTDSFSDIYDARVEGGFAEPAPAPAQCTGDACQGNPGSPPASQAAGTSSFVGPANPPTRKKKHHKHKKKSRKQHKPKKHKANKQPRRSSANRGGAK